MNNSSDYIFGQGTSSVIDPMVPHLRTTLTLLTMVKKIMIMIIVIIMMLITKSRYKSSLLCFRSKSLLSLKKQAILPLTYKHKSKKIRLATASATTGVIRRCRMVTIHCLCRTSWTTVVHETRPMSYTWTIKHSKLKYATTPVYRSTRVMTCVRYRWSSPPPHLAATRVMYRFFCLHEGPALSSHNNHLMNHHSQWLKRLGLI